MKNLLTLFFLCLCISINAQNTILDTNIKTLKGKKTSLKDITENNELIVATLWATWCVPCINELDAISDVYEDWQEETNVKLFAISVDDSRTAKRIKPLVNGKGWEFDILLDANNDLMRAIGTSSVPLTLVIKKGKIVYRHSGYTPGSEDELYEIIKKHQ